EKDCFLKYDEGDPLRLGLQVKLDNFNVNNCSLFIDDRKEAISKASDVNDPAYLANKLRKLDPSNNGIGRYHDRKNDRYSLVLVTNGRPIIFTERARGEGNFEYYQEFEN